MKIHKALNVGSSIFFYPIKLPNILKFLVDVHNLVSLIIYLYYLELESSIQNYLFIFRLGSDLIELLEVNTIILTFLGAIIIIIEYITDRCPTHKGKA